MRTPFAAINKVKTGGTVSNEVIYVAWYAALSVGPGFYEGKVFTIIVSQIGHCQFLLTGYFFIIARQLPSFHIHELIDVHNWLLLL